jgi:hypothetical protein
MINITKDAVLFQLGQTVYHKADQKKGIITGIVFRSIGIVYIVTWAGQEDKYHYEIELTETAQPFAVEGIETDTV